MIDVENERIISLTAACRLPAMCNPRTGKPCAVGQVYRYVGPGARDVNGDRVKLETIKLPSGLATSVEAVTRFIARLTDPDADEAIPTPKRRQNEINAAERELAAAGMI